MGKIFFAIGVIYILYYLGNIIYDLFIKKDTKPVGDENLEVYELNLEDEPASVQNIEIDDVENLNTPNSYHSKISRTTDDDSEPMISNDEVEKRYENEQKMENISSFSNPTEIQEQTPTELKETKIQERKPDYWQSMINQAETTVVVSGTVDGYTLYKSLI